jgi:hypothetical protein
LTERTNLHSFQNEWQAGQIAGIVNALNARR